MILPFDLPTTQQANFLTCARTATNSSFSKHNDPTAKQPNVPLGYRFRVGLVRVRIRVPRQGGGHHLPSPVTIISPSGKKSLTSSWQNPTSLLKHWHSINLPGRVLCGHICTSSPAREDLRGELKSVFQLIKSFRRRVSKALLFTLSLGLLLVKKVNKSPTTQTKPSDTHSSVVHTRQCSHIFLLFLFVILRRKGKTSQTSTHQIQIDTYIYTYVYIMYIYTINNYMIILHTYLVPGSNQINRVDYTGLIK